MLKSLRHPNHSGLQSLDYARTPFLVIWETTHACDLACVHCRASADPNPSPKELTHEEGLRLIREVKEMGTPIIVFSGGDPLKRKDLPELIRYAKSLDLKAGTIPAVTPLLTEERILELKAAGLDQIAFSLDAPSAKDHDAFRQVEGVYERTLHFVKFAHKQGLAVQINSLLNVHNEETLKELIMLVEKLPIVFWEVFFLVPVGRGEELSVMDAKHFDVAFEHLYRLHKRAKFLIKVTEAPHYRQFYIRQEMIRDGKNPDLVEREGLELPEYMRRMRGPRGSIGRAPSGVNAGKGFVFVSHEGDVFPSGFLPVSGGNIRNRNLSAIYRDSEIFKQLRNTAMLKGRCGMCCYRDICGGSRSRAYAVTGDYLAEDPSCSYQPSGEAAGK